MIQRLLEWAVQNPHVAFTEAELRALDEDGFERLVAQGIVTRDEHRRASVVREGLLLSVDELPSGGFEASDDDDPEFGTIAVNEQELTTWRFDPLEFARQLARTHGLGGKPHKVHPRVFFVGEMGTSVAVVLGFPRTERELLELAGMLPSMLASRYGGRVLIAPGDDAFSSVERELESLDVALAHLSGDGRAVVPELGTCLRRLHAREQSTGFDEQTGFRWSPDFRSVVSKGVGYRLTTQQAQVIELLWGTYRNGTPEVAEATILDRIGTSAQELRHTFRNHQAWGALVVRGKTKGTVALDP